jgi:hypothetical protein
VEIDVGVVALVLLLAVVDLEIDGIARRAVERWWPSRAPAADARPKGSG